MNHDHLKELAEIYALGALDGRELEEFQLHLSGGCVECEKFIGDTQDALGLFSRSSFLAVPPASLKARVLSCLDGSVRPTSGARIVPAVGALLGAGVLAAALFWFYPRTVETLFLPESSGHSAGMQSVLSSPDLKKIFLQSSDSRSERYAVLAWNPKSCGGCFVVKGLSAPAAGKVYQLWALEGNKKPISVGTFNIGPDGNAHVDFEDMKNKKAFSSFVVTLEPSGGSALPAGPALLLGHL